MSRALMGFGVAIVAFIGNMFCVPNARACQCGYTGPDWFGAFTVEEILALYDYDAVFSGEVVSNGMTESSETLVLHMRVVDVWQGRVYEEQKLDIDGFCLVSLPEGQEYIIFANRREGRLRVSRCSPYIALAEADEVLQQLGMGELPLPGSNDPATCGLAGILPVLLTLTGLFVCSSRARLFNRRRNEPTQQSLRGLSVELHRPRNESQLSPSSCDQKT